MKKLLAGLLLLSFSSFGGVTEKEFSDVKESLLSFYEGRGTVTIKALWDNDKVNAYTKTENRNINMYFMGGLLRSRTININSLALVMCHEFGHHRGGYPYGIIQNRRDDGNAIRYSETSNEGQSDYWASNECMWEFLSDVIYIGKLKPICQGRYVDYKNQSICSQIIQAGYDFLNLIENNDLTQSLQTLPVVNRNLYRGEYPSQNCRMNIFIAGALKRQRKQECWFYN